MYHAHISGTTIQQPHTRSAISTQQDNRRTCLIMICSFLEPRRTMLSQSFSHHDQTHSTAQQGMHSITLSLWALPAHLPGRQGCTCSAWQGKTPQRDQLRRQPQTAVPACVDRWAHGGQPCVKARRTAFIQSKLVKGCWGRAPWCYLSSYLLEAVCCMLSHRSAFRA